MTNTIRKTLTAILAIIMLVATMSVTAFAAEYTPTPRYPGYTPYAGDDFSEEAVYERMTALEEVYPTGTPWTTTKAGGNRGCGDFAIMLQQVAFGYVYDGKTMLESRVHNNIDELRVGDYVNIPSNIADSHIVCVLSIKDGIVTVAEGNINKKVMWGRQFTIKELSPGGAKATREIISYYNEDGEVVRRAINTTTAPAATETTPVATTAPAQTTTTTPAAPVAEIKTETKTATTAIANGTLVVTNITNANMKSFSVTLGDYHKNLGSGAKDKDYTSFKSALETYGFKLTSTANNDSVTVTYAGKSATIGVGQTATITAEGIVTIK